MVLHNLIFTTTTAAMDNTSAKSADKPSLLAESLTLRFAFSALTADTLWFRKNRKFFHLHKCINPKCSFIYAISPRLIMHLNEDYGKNKYKIHYLYREFTVDFFRMDLDFLPKNGSSLKFSKHNSHIMSLCLTMHVKLGTFPA